MTPYGQCCDARTLECASDFHDIVLSVAPQDYLLLQLPCSLNSAERWDLTQLMFHRGDHRVFSLTHDQCWLLETAISLEVYLQKLLGGELKRTIDLKQDIGLILHRNIQETDPKSQRTYEEANRYLVTGYSHSEDLWLYQWKGEYMLEISTSYPWHFPYPPPEFEQPVITEYMQPLDEWLERDYKILYRATLSRATVEEWLRIITNTFTIMTRNYRHACALSGITPPVVPPPGPDGVQPMVFAEVPDISVKEDMPVHPFSDPCIYHGAVANASGHTPPV